MFACVYLHNRIRFSRSPFFFFSLIVSIAIIKRKRRRSIVSAYIQLFKKSIKSLTTPYEELFK